MNGELKRRKLACMRLEACDLLANKKSGIKNNKRIKFNLKIITEKPFEKCKLNKPFICQFSTRSDK